MKIVRANKNGKMFFGMLDHEKIYSISGEPYSFIEYDGKCFDLKDVSLLAPVIPTKIVAVGKNYHEHALEMKEIEPTEPLLFLKPSTCVVGNLAKVYYPKISRRLDYEGELGVVIGKKCHFVSEREAKNVIFGYTCLNDVTARDIQKSDPQWTRGKSFDTFCPIGPWIETELDPFDLEITTRLNGVIRQSSRTSFMTHNICKLISYITRVMTLLPGDIIATGTPAGIGTMNIGDSVEVEIEGIGILKNTIAGEDEIL
ncbi:MAG: fumarylacetoacetate hydrolase family protein [Clostridia bacterium]